MRGHMSFEVHGWVLLLMRMKNWRLPPSSFLRSPSLSRVLVWRLFTWQRWYVANYWVRMYCGSCLILHSSCLPRFPWQMPSISYGGLVSLMLSISQMTWPPSFKRYASFSLHFPSFFFSCIFAHRDIQI